MPATVGDEGATEARQARATLDSMEVVTSDHCCHDDKLLDNPSSHSMSRHLERSLGTLDG